MHVGEPLESAARKLTGLFIDDRYFALAVAAWILALALASRFTHLAPGTLGAGFFFGLAIILIVSVARAARQLGR